MLDTAAGTLSTEPVRRRRARSAVCTHMMHLSVRDNGDPDRWIKHKLFRATEIDHTLMTCSGWITDRSSHTNLINLFGLRYEMMSSW